MVLEESGGEVAWAEHELLDQLEGAEKEYGEATLRMVWRRRI